MADAQSTQKHSSPDGDVIPIAEGKQSRKKRKRKRDDRHPILLTTHEKQIADEVVSVLAQQANLYQRGGWLVQVLEERSRSAQHSRKPRARIRPVPPASLQEQMSEYITFQRPSLTEKDGHKEKSTRPVHPPAWCVRAVHARGDWQGIRRLQGIADFPLWLGGGRVLTERGYDSASEIYQCYRGPKISLPDRVTPEMGQQAARELLDLTCDFPFANEYHRIAWLAGCITPAARFAFEGAAPLFLTDGNVAGTGKSKLCNVVARIYLRRNFSCTTYPTQSEEWSKLLTSYALNGSCWLMFDNLVAPLGDGNLDAVLTNPYWESRMLGSNEIISEPILLTFYATGNNVRLKGDIGRRICYCRLESPLEHPEDRARFRFPNLLSMVGKKSAHFMSCILKIFISYYQAGSPAVELLPMGSFEEWTAVVRSPLVWHGFPDPAQGFRELQESSDGEREDMAALLDLWSQIQPGRQGMTANEFWRELFVEQSGKISGPDYQLARQLVEGLVYKQGPRSLGKLIGKHRGRVFSGLRFTEAGKSHNVMRWYADCVTDSANGRHSPPNPPEAPDACETPWG